MNQYLLFDLDGTLTDPKIGITTCVQYALDSFGIKEPNLDKLEPFIGPPLKDSFMEFYGMDEEQAEHAIEKYRERFQTVGMYENEVYPGIKRLLRRCKNHGAKLAVASSKPEVFVKKILEHFGLARYFDVIVGSELNGQRVAKEEVVQEALSQLFGGKEIDYDNTVMIGDRRFDIEGAKENGVVSVAVSYGYGPMEELKASHPDYIARTVAELEDLLLRGRSKGKEKAVISWHKPSALEKTWRMLLPLAVYIVCSDVLRVFAALAGVSSGFVFFSMFLLLYFTMGRSDLIQERFWFNVRNATEEHGIGVCKTDSVVRKLLIGICLVTLAVGMAIGCTVLFGIAGLTESSQAFEQVSQRQMAVGLVKGLVLYGVLSPLTEELIFRGILFTRMKRYLPVTVSGLVSALVFGFYHGNAIQALYGFLAGCVLAWLYHKSGRFMLAVILHGLLNIAGFLWAYCTFLHTALYSWGGCIGALILAAISVSVLAVLLNRRTHENSR